MPSLKHPSINDGWFREISPEWPGQAFCLKANKVLHVERSLYQDVLVFESETYGNVLVLDGVVQCTERDEFAYQEMISHLPLASHPDPKRVLVVGGGDGGVVREVLKHESVVSVVLCDIDEAVIRVSKQYLPHMSSLLSDRRVTVHIGDGLHFLSSGLSSSTPGSTYDVIITDCSDPNGPAAALFERPYFELLATSLKPGGHISIQAESIWLHLPSVRALLDTARPFFPVVEYAYATVPTYPSGQIGFLVASKDPTHDLRHPRARRGVASARYYNADVHRAAFVLPEFCRAFLEEGRDVRPREDVHTYSVDLKKCKELRQKSMLRSKPVVALVSAI
ncbi:spermidine synthase [Ganoderma leucocontextum]|nr:spermidine synthase [Ganoderma leucocontextum]